MPQEPAVPKEEEERKMENSIPNPDSEMDKEDDSHPLDFDHSLKTTYFPSGGDHGGEGEPEIPIVEEEIPKKNSPNSFINFFNGCPALEGMMGGVWSSWVWACGCVAWVLVWPRLALTHYNPTL